jgi:hypothetical protein
MVFPRLVAQLTCPRFGLTVKSLRAPVPHGPQSCPPCFSFPFRCPHPHPRPRPLPRPLPLSAPTRLPGSGYVGAGSNVTVVVTALGMERGLVASPACSILGVNVTSSFMDWGNGTYTFWCVHIEAPLITGPSCASSVCIRCCLFAMVARCPAPGSLLDRGLGTTGQGQAVPCPLAWP